MNPQISVLKSFKIAKLHKSHHNIFHTPLAPKKMWKCPTKKHPTAWSQQKCGNARWMSRRATLSRPHGPRKGSGRSGLVWAAKSRVGSSSFKSLGSLKHKRDFSTPNKERYIYIYDWLVVWNIWILTFHVLGIITPTDEVIFFQRGSNHQPDDIINHNTMGFEPQKTWISRWVFNPKPEPGEYWHFKVPISPRAPTAEKILQRSQTSQNYPLVN